MTPLTMTDSPPIPLDTPFVIETDGVVVRVAPNFLADESRPEDSHYVWAYTVEVENRREEVVTLRRRFWEIIDARGHCQAVSGRGVVGQEPEIAPGGAFRYTSGAPLSAASGLMRGVYELERPNGELLNIAIPAFSLDSPHETSVPS